MDNGWHSVRSGDYPAMHKDVLVWFENGVKPVIGRWTGFDWLCRDGRIYIASDSVVAWHELPEPYIES